MEKTEAMEDLGKSSGKVMNSLKSMVRDAEKVLENSAQQGSETYQNAKRKLESTLSDAKFALRDLEDVVITRAKNVAADTAEYAKEHPWQTAGAAAVVGLLIGMLIARK